MKVLVISHNVFSDTESMGKTLSSYFSDFLPEELAQIYVHSQVPTSNICHRYFRITDKEAIKSIFGGKAGHALGAQDIEDNRDDARTDTGITASIYQWGRKRTPMIYLARNLWWRLSHWNSKQLQEWLDEFDPECIFFASGDYAFLYHIAWTISISRKIPLYVSCMDDYYFYNRNDKKVMGRLQHKLFMRTVHRTINLAEKIFCICEKMSEDYAAYFHKPCITVHTPATIEKPLQEEKKAKISYLGNLGYKRDRQLIAIGRAVKALGLEPDHIDVYSVERRKEILENLTEENGIIFHGAVGAKEVLKIMGESLAVIHTESFNNKIRQSVRYSVSTKLADSLTSGTCLFAYGPEEIASIHYLEKENAAICCTSERELPQKLRTLIKDTAARERIQKNALRLAQNHASDRTPQIIRKEIDNT